MQWFNISSGQDGSRVKKLLPGEALKISFREGFTQARSRTEPLDIGDKINAALLGEAG